MVKRFLSLGLALLLSLSFLFYLPNEKVSAEEYSVSDFLVGDCPFTEEIVLKLVESCDSYLKSKGSSTDVNSFTPFSLSYSSNSYYLYFLQLHG